MAAQLPQRGAGLGHDLDLTPALDRLPVYLAMFAFVAFLGGGREEAGWRGFALPWLRWRPWQATLVIGIVWGVWHIPLGWILPLFLAFYTYLYNVTGSVLACDKPDLPVVRLD